MRIALFAAFSGAACLWIRHFKADPLGRSSLRIGEIPALKMCIRDRHDNDGGSLAGLNARVDKALEIHFLIQEQAHDQTVEGGDGRGFGRGHDAAVDAAEHDDRNHERPLGVPILSLIHISSNELSRT